MQGPADFQARICFSFLHGPFHPSSFYLLVHVSERDQSLTGRTTYTFSNKTITRSSPCLGRRGGICEAQMILLIPLINQPAPHCCALRDQMNRSFAKYSYNDLLLLAITKYWSRFYLCVCLNYCYLPVLFHFCLTIILAAPAYSSHAYYLTASTTTELRFLIIVDLMHLTRVACLSS